MWEFIIRVPINNMPKKSDSRFCYFSLGNLGFGLFLIIIGVFLLGRELGWFSVKFSVWPVILIAFGIWMVLKSYGR